MPNGEQHEHELHTPEPPKRRVAKPEPKRQRRTSTGAKLALALVETHLKGVYSQMALLEKAIAELREQLQ